MTFRTQNRETGQPIETGILTRERAEEIIQMYETDDKAQGVYEPDFYEVAEESTGSMKHTQGEWTAKRSKKHLTRTEIWVDTDFEPTFEILRNETSSAESAANARLIAAAPDLLEALDTAVQYIDAKRYPELMQMCEAAISKAKGE